MKRLANIKKWAPVIGLLWLTGPSCTKLDVKTYSVIPSSIFWQNAAEIAAGKAPAYASLTNISVGSGYDNLVEVSSDEKVFPTRGTDWYDGGQWARMYYHTSAQSDVDGNLNGTWGGIFSGAGNANFVIYTLQNLPAGTDVNLQADIAEMTALRSLYYYKAMDMFGNIPYVTNFKVDPSTVTNIPRAQVFDSLEKDLKTALPNLSTSVNQTTYGKVTKYFAFSLLARMYLNAKVYTGTDRSADCIAMCDSIINSGIYSLETNYFTPFYGSNSQSLENIFVVPMSSNNLIGGNGFVQASIEFNSALTFGIPCCGYGNNGASSTRDFYQYFDTSSTYSSNVVTINGRAITQKLRTFNDMRTAQFLIGQQFQGDGVTNYPPNKNWVVDNTDVCCTYDGDASVAATTRIGDDYNSIKSPVIYHDDMTVFTAPSTDYVSRHAGVRNIKYWPQPGPSNGNMSNAWVIFRYADILLMRAESEYNTSDLGNALIDFNTVRARAYGNHSHDWIASDLTPANILAERGRELAWENVRRTDQVRFGTYTAARNYPPKPADADNHTIILPIPQVQLDNNKNLKQNPGY
ncbi:MAG TPA: RagB/SusD family nutrient uptake outer membrane protein [Puia sp.]